MTRRSSTGKGPTSVRNIARRSSPSAAAQSRVARAYIAQLDQAEAFDTAIVTTIESDRVFYPAEDYHQDFMELNPTYPYIVRNDAPKLEALQVLFPDLFRTEPALVGGADSIG